MISKRRKYQIKDLFCQNLWFVVLLVFIFLCLDWICDLFVGIFGLSKGFSCYLNLWMVLLVCLKVLLLSSFVNCPKDCLKVFVFLGQMECSNGQVSFLFWFHGSIWKVFWGRGAKIYISRTKLWTFV